MKTDTDGLEHGLRRSRDRRRTGLHQGTTRLMGRAQSKHPKFQTPEYLENAKQCTGYAVSIFGVGEFDEYVY